MIQKCWKCGVAHNNKTRVTGLERCPSCDAIAYTKPYDEGFLQECQEKFFQSRELSERKGDIEILTDPKSDTKFTLYKGDNKYLDMMFPVLLEYAKKIVRKKTPQIYLNDTDVEEKAMITVGTMLRYYKTKDHFEIKASFGSYLGDIALHPLFNEKDRKRDSMEQSLNVLVHNGDTELQDIVTRYSVDKAFEDELMTYDIFKQEAISEVMEVIELMLQAMKDQRGIQEYNLLMTALRLELDEEVHQKKRGVFWNLYRYYPNGESREALFEKARFALIEGLKKTLSGGEDLDGQIKDMLNSLLQTKRHRGPM